MDKIFNRYLNQKLRAHVSWLTPSWVKDRSGFVAGEWVEQFTRAGITDILFYSKFHDGFCTFNSKHREVQPDRNYLGELMDAAKGTELAVSVYYSAGIDTCSGQTHPEWACRDFDGAPLHESFADIIFYNCCFNSGYRDFMLAQIKELVEDYGVAGVWYDLYTFPRNKVYNYGTCYCTECQKKFTQWSRGRTLWECQGSKVEQQFRMEMLKNLLIDTKKILEADGVKRMLSFNGAGAMWDYTSREKEIFRELDKYVDYISMESLWGNDARNASFNMRSSRSDGKPFESISAISDTSVSWSMRNTDVIIAEAAQITAHGGIHMACVDPTAEGKIYDCQIDQLGEVKRYLDARMEYITNTSPIYDAGLWGTKFIGVDGKRVFSGWGTAFLQQHIMYGILYKDNSYDAYPAIVVDGTYDATIEDKKRLVEYVKNGGSLIVDRKGAYYYKDTYDEYQDMLGVKILCDNPFNVQYIGGFAPDISEGMSEYPMLVKSGAYEIVPTTARVLATFYEPQGNYQRHTAIFTQTASPKRFNSGKPAITINKFGEGQVIYIACDFGEKGLYHVPGEIVQCYTQKLAANLLSLLLGKRGKSLTTNAAAGVELIANKQDGRIIVHMVNNYLVPMQYYNFERNSMKLSGITLSLNENELGAVTRICRVPQGEDIIFTRDQSGNVQWSVPELSIHEMFVVE